MSRALVFPGQGAQYVGMAAGFATAVPAAGALLTQADAILGFSLSAVIANGPEAELTRTDISQPAILVASLMAYEALKSKVGPIEAAAVEIETDLVRDEARKRFLCINRNEVIVERV